MNKRIIYIFTSLLLVSALFISINRQPTIVSASTSVATHKTSLISMPEQIDVNGITWRIKETDLTSMLGTKLNGYTDCSIREIYISSTAINKHTALMHEITHAAVCTDAAFDFTVNNLYFNSKTNVDHEGIYKFTEFWAAMLQRNTELAKYLTQKGE